MIASVESSLILLDIFFKLRIILNDTIKLIFSKERRSKYEYKST